MVGVRLRLICTRSRVHLLQDNMPTTLSNLVRNHPRLFSSAVIRWSDSKDVTGSSNDKSDPSKETPIDTRHMVPVHWLDKKTLVWDKRYKSVEEVPNMLPYQSVVASRNRFRIRANLVMIGLTILAACIMVYTGKERAKSGDTIDKRNLEKHRRLRAEKREEEEELAALDSGAAAK